MPKRPPPNMFSPDAFEALPTPAGHDPHAEPAPPLGPSRHAESGCAPPAGQAAASVRLGALGKLVHEMRTPLSGVLGLARLMEADAPLSARQRRRLALINECCQHLLQLVDDILDFARLDARLLSLQPRPTDLAALLADTLAMVHPLADARGLGLRLTLPGHLPPRLLVDGRRLRQVLLNLLANAIKFTERGGVLLRVDLLQAPGGEGAGQDGRWQVCFAVEDSGCGLSADQLGQLYQLFRRPGAGPETPDGSGVGLIVSRELVSLMGGELSLRSTQGRGTVVSFTLALEGSSAAGTPAAGAAA